MSFIPKTLIILASSIKPNQIEIDIKERYDVSLLKYRSVPKALLPVSGKPLLSWWYNYSKILFQNIYIVSNAYNFKHFERWASGVNFPRENILNSGLSTGVLSDLAFVHRIKDIQSDIIITPADFIGTNESLTSNILDTFANSINFVYTNEKNTPVAFGMSLSVLRDLDHRDQLSYNQDTEWLYELRNFYNGLDTQKFKIESPSHFDYVNSDVSLQHYLDHWNRSLDSILEKHYHSIGIIKKDPIHMKAYARVGLMGNPSDGFYGKTMSLLISNFWAEATLIPNPLDQQQLETITILPNPVSNPHSFPSIEGLVGISNIDGYETGDRLLQACCKVFYTFCQEENIKINTHQGFKLMFETNIPRQVGLAGSSAIITAVWKALTEFYGVSISLERQASLILRVEQDELGIAAGLQDRVIQSFGGLVYMNFDREYLDQHGYGKYESLDVELLPKLWLAYVADPEDSGKVHSNVKQRFLNGDPEIINAMQTFASFTDQARDSLIRHDHSAFATLMSDNFNLRRKTYGDQVVGTANLRMIELARQHRCSAKFPGSGGAIVGMWNGKKDIDSETKDLLQLRRALEKEGFVFLELIPKVY